MYCHVEGIKIVQQFENIAGNNIVQKDDVVIKQVVHVIYQIRKLVNVRPLKFNVWGYLPQSKLFNFTN